MCGASDSQNQVSAEQNAFYSQLTKQYSTVFGESQGIVGALTSAFTPILNAGPNQAGYSAAERTALNTQATEGTAADYAHAQTATSEALAARGGGNEFTPNGADNQMLATNTNAAAGEQAGLQNQIVQNDYAEGHQNWQNAAAELGSTAGLVNPTSFAGATSSAGSDAASTANQIASQDNSVWQGALGAVTALGGAATTGFLNKRP